jgi:hypothetical protein
MHDFFKIIFGDFTSWLQLFGYFWFFLVGYAIYFLTEATGRDKRSSHTPVKWSWKFWYYDNWRRYLTTILCTYVLFRFYIEICGHPFGNFDAVTLGLIGDGLGATLKRRVKSIGADRDELMKENVADELVSNQKDTADELTFNQKDSATGLKLDQEFTADELKSKQKVVADKLKEENKR